MTFDRLQIAPALPEFLASDPAVQIDLSLTDALIDLARALIAAEVRRRGWRLVLDRARSGRILELAACNTGIGSQRMKSSGDR
jgi:hypothetical protein